MDSHVLDLAMKGPWILGLPGGVRGPSIERWKEASRMYRMYDAALVAVLRKCELQPPLQVSELRPGGVASCKNPADENPYHAPGEGLAGQFS